MSIILVTDTVVFLIEPHFFFPSVPLEADFRSQFSKLSDKLFQYTKSNAIWIHRSPTCLLFKCLRCGYNSIIKYKGGVEFYSSLL